MKSTEFKKELNSKDIKQLNASLIKHRDKLHELRRDITMGKLKNMREIRQNKKEIAQIMTAMNNKAEIIVQTPSEETSNDKD